jgi:formamidopyrimidine-DNA glycosylase
MPELPEVETIRRSLETKILGCIIRKVAVLNRKTIKTPPPDLFAARLEGEEITGFQRRGKYLIMEIGCSMVLVVHLRMTGRLIVKDSGFPINRYTRLIFYLNEGKELHFQDIRKFGTMHLLDRQDLDAFTPFKALGYDALDPRLTPDLFKERLKGRKGQVKGLLLNQSFIAGIGNIYANEILWRAGINPQRRADSLDAREQQRLYQAIGEVIAAAISHRGTTLRDYVDGDGNQGEFQNMLQVHGKGGRPCPSCGNSIVRIKQGGRSSYYCPSCQK